LTERGRRVTDVAERKKIYSELQQILAEEVPEIYLWYPHNVIVMSEKVHGFIPYPEGNFVSFRDVWIEE
jgi:peptide/nickel transport system substrate-binding protein